MKWVSLLLAAALLAGCATNGYTKFYTGLASPAVIKSRRAAPPPETPIIERSPRVPDAAAMGRLGYVAIGYSSFNSGDNDSDDDAIEQAQDVHADLVVIINPHYTGSRSSEVPLTLPTSQTSYSSGSATAYGAGGSVTAYGNSTTTTYGSRTTYIPITVSRYDYGAIYYVKLHYNLGVNWRPLNQDERARLQSNSGLYVELVVNGSPAYRADILHGDIIKAIGGTPVYGVESGARLAQKYRGQTVPITIIRNGREIIKQVALGN